LPAEQHDGLRGGRAECRFHDGKGRAEVDVLPDRGLQVGNLLRGGLFSRPPPVGVGFELLGGFGDDLYVASRIAVTLKTSGGS
jgi:hypothetical protein